MSEWKRRWALAGWLLAAVWGSGYARAQTTTVQDTITDASGAPAAGTVVVSWAAFTTAAGATVAAGSLSTTLGAGGVLSVGLLPNAGATPMGSYYTAVYHLNDGTASREFWVVPVVGSGTVKLAAIRNQVLPTSMAMQTVSKQYVDTTVARAVAGVTVAGGASGSAGGDLTGSYPNPTVAAVHATAGTLDGVAVGQTTPAAVNGTTIAATNPTASTAGSQNPGSGSLCWTGTLYNNASLPYGLCSFVSTTSANSGKFSTQLSGALAANVNFLYQFAAPAAALEAFSTNDGLGARIAESYNAIYFGGDSNRSFAKCAPGYCYFLAIDPSTGKVGSVVPPAGGTPPFRNLLDDGNGNMSAATSVIAPLFQETLTTPASSTANCTAGQFTDDANFHYVCVAASTWKRVALSAF